MHFFEKCKIRYDPNVISLFCVMKSNKVLFPFLPSDLFFLDPWWIIFIAVSTAPISSKRLHSSLSLSSHRKEFQHVEEEKLVYVWDTWRPILKYWEDEWVNKNHDRVFYGGDEITPLFFSCPQYRKNGDQEHKHFSRVRQSSEVDCDISCRFWIGIQMALVELKKNLSRQYLTGPE